MFCYFCGKENKDEQKFCKYCGKTLHPDATDDSGPITEKHIENHAEHKATETRVEIKSFEEPQKVKKSGIKGLLIAVIVLLSLLLVIIGIGIAVFFKGGFKQMGNEMPSREETVENETVEFSTESKRDGENFKNKDVDEALKKEPTSDHTDQSSKEILENFIAGKLTADIFDKEQYYSDIEKNYMIDSQEYRDVDNDGEEELLIYSSDFCPLMALDANNGKITVLCAGDGTAAYLTFYDVDGITWACHSDTSHKGRQTYFFTQYKGPDIVDEFALNAEYWDNENDRYDESSLFTYRNHEISMQEYEELLQKYADIEPEHDITEATEISITSTVLEDYSTVSYQGYHSDLGSKNFRFIYPTNLYENIQHDRDINITENYGTLIERVFFTGGSGTSLEYKMYHRNEQYSKNDMLNAVYLGELTKLIVLPGADPNVLAPKVENEYGLSVISGWNEDATKIVYEVIDVEDEYILIMKLIAPDIEAAKTMTTELYDGCGFNRDRLWENKGE